MGLAFDENDMLAAESIDKLKGRIIRGVEKMVDGAEIGMYIHGRGGTGKSYLVKATLNAKLGNNEHMTPAECWMVAEFIIEQQRSLSTQPFTIRMVTRGFANYLYALRTKSDWKMEVADAIDQDRLSYKPSQDERIENEIDIALE